MEGAGSDESQEKGPEHSRRTAADIQVTCQVWWHLPYRQCSSTCLVCGCMRAVQDVRGLLVIVVSQRSNIVLYRLTARVPSSQSVCKRFSVFSSYVVQRSVADHAGLVSTNPSSNVRRVHR
jgi:RNA polymerase subunit RPABC4/transcription elongation factor Spt4